MIKTIQKNMNKKGFTLVELIIVIAVMAILAAIVIPRMGGVTTTFKQRADKESAEMLARQLEVIVQSGGTSVTATSTAAALTNTILGDTGTLETSRTGGAWQYTYASNTITVFAAGQESSTKATINNVKKID